MEAVTTIFNQYLDLIHHALVRRYGTPEKMRELLPEEVADLAELIFTEDEQAEMTALYDQYVAAFCAFCEAAGLPESSPGREIREDSAKRAWASAWEQFGQLDPKRKAE